MTRIARPVVIALAYSVAFTIGAVYWCKGAVLCVKDKLTEALT